MYEEDFLLAHPVGDVIATHHHRSAGMDGGGGEFRTEAHLDNRRAGDAVGAGFIQAQQNLVVFFQNAVVPFFEAVQLVPVAVVPFLTAMRTAEFAVVAFAVGDFISAFETMMDQFFIFHNGRRWKGFLTKAEMSKFVFLKFDKRAFFPISAICGKNAKMSKKRNTFSGL